MSLILFACVWVATWAMCWFGLARVWPSSRRVVTIRVNWPDHAPIPPKTYVEGNWWRLSGAREWAPLIATVVAFAVDWSVS